MRRPRVDRFAALARPLLVFLLDALLHRYPTPRWVRGPLDELAHAVTVRAFLAPGRRPPWSPRLRGALAGATLLDIDHLPQLFGARWLAAPGERPYTHSLLFPIALVALARPFEREARSTVEGVAAGVATHLLRDMATGGVLLCWPFYRRSIQVPYWLYAASLLLLAAVDRGEENR